MNFLGHATPVTFPGGVSVVGHPTTQCLVRSDNVLEIHAHGAEGGVSIAFERLNLPSVKSLSNQVLEFDLEFLVKPDGDVGRHGGIYYGNHQSDRQTKGNTCLDWIDRADDRGYRFYETGSDHHLSLNVLLPRRKEPINHLKIIIKDNGEQILVAGDDIWKVRNVGPVHLLDKPCLGFWVWPNNQIRISNFVVRPYTGKVKKKSIF